MRQILFRVPRSVEEHENRKLQASNKTICIFDFHISQRNTEIRSYKLVIKFSYFQFPLFTVRNTDIEIYTDLRIPYCGKMKSNSVAFGHLEDLGSNMDKLWAVFCSFISYGNPCSCIFCLGSNQIPQNYIHQ